MEITWDSSLPYKGSDVVVESQIVNLNFPGHVYRKLELYIKYFFLYNLVLEELYTRSNKLEKGRSFISHYF